MGKKVFLGVSSKAHNVKKLYLGVSGKAHKVIKGFIGVNGKAHQFYSAESSQYNKVTLCPSRGISYQDRDTTGAILTSGNFPNPINSSYNIAVTYSGDMLFQAGRVSSASVLRKLDPVSKALVTQKDGTLGSYGNYTSFYGSCAGSKDYVLRTQGEWTSIDPYTLAYRGAGAAMSSSMSFLSSKTSSTFEQAVNSDGTVMNYEYDVSTCSLVNSISNWSRPLIRCVATFGNTLWGTNTEQAGLVTGSYSSKSRPTTQLLPKPTSVIVTGGACYV